MRNSSVPSRTLKIYGITAVLCAAILGLGALLSDHMGMLFVMSMTASVGVATGGILLSLLYSLYKVFSQFEIASQDNDIVKLSSKEVSNLILSLSTFVLFPLSLYYPLSPIGSLFLAPSIIFIRLEAISMFKGYADTNLTQPEANQTKQNIKPIENTKEHKVLGWQHKARQQASKDNHKSETIDNAKPTERRRAQQKMG